MAVVRSVASVPDPLLLSEQASAPASETDSGWVYSKDVAGRTELFYEDDTGAQIQITSGGAVNAGAADVAANKILRANFLS
ncbi:MAG: hypothetical protein K8T20_11825 [Planctomycetes bacterium]|nr:hypothetical protein [Planctomycetota bacterium]